MNTSADGSALFLDDLRPGMSWETRGRTVTEADLVTFGTWSGDLFPLHFDEEYAKRTQFGGRIFHGMGGLAIAVGLEMSLGWKIGSVIAFIGIREWNFLEPIRMGDTIRVWEEVAEVRPSVSKPDRGTVTTRVRLRNQDDVVCQEGTWVMLFSRRVGG
ncbi:MaoC/PaaZ C-terminal domain-containing protein [Amycolatopsis sp. YIM 10]|uniref:MaoC family dehydratase n=1 Tax=Amycolatopsis sp. YIM 10 TaxID=2653857 RepID=UPI00129047F3|nr:MaoC/PaaZ C-terminal domain-containing protein [Amycolatopsis sp. YIM 10]QFU90532.1 Bifunctional protein PaaZ [Amycolatopsis sp. YIM 10]